MCTTAFAGGAGLSQEGALDLNIAAESATTGTLAVAKGRLIMSKADDVKYQFLRFHVHGMLTFWDVKCYNLRVHVPKEVSCL